MKRKTTTIKISLETRNQLLKLKVHPRETYEDVIRRLIKMHN